MRLSMVKISFKVKGVHQDENTEVQIAPSPPPPAKKKKETLLKGSVRVMRLFMLNYPCANN